MSSNDKNRKNAAPASEIRELGDSENARVAGGAYLRSSSFSTKDSSFSTTFKASTYELAESYTTLGCIDTDDGTLWGCPKLTS